MPFLETLDQAIEHLATPLSGPREYALDTLCDYIESDEADTSWLESTLLPSILSNMVETLGEKDNVTVYCRSFSTLVLASLVERDAILPYFSEGQFELVLDTAIKAISEEIDYRGYVNETEGWAHSVAHAADLTRELFKHPDLSKEQSYLLIDSWLTLFKNPALPLLQYDEEQRLALALMTLHHKSGLSSGQMASFIDELLDDEKELWYQTAYQKPVTLNRFTNVRNLVVALYLQCQLGKQSNGSESLLQFLTVQIRKLDSGYYQ
jgi:hypothetical protein